VQTFSERVALLEQRARGQIYIPTVYVVSRALSPEYTISQIPKPWNPYIFITESKMEKVAVRK
jgi:hypothetical protein